jgi:anti-sigma factor RsiW
MDRCPEDTLLLSYFYGELDGAGAESIEKHLRSCSACREEAESLSALRNYVKRNIPSREPGEETVSAVRAVSYEVMDELRASLRSQTRFPAAEYIRRALFATGALAAVAASLLLLLYPKETAKKRIAENGYDARLSVIRQKIEEIDAGITRERDPKTRVYESALSEIRERVEALNSEIGEDI